MNHEPVNSCDALDAHAEAAAAGRQPLPFWAKASAYWTLIKSRQTLLLLAAGLAGYLTAKPASVTGATISLLSLSLFLAISGATALNMVADRDIDARMTRTARRPLPAGVISVREALIFGVAITALGLILAFALQPIFGLLVSAGAFFDLVIYTLWLKRRSPSSIIFGGVSGAMPIIAGRALCIGHVDGLGILLGLSVLLWIPSHIMPLWIRYAADYRDAGIPTWPQAYGLPATRWFIAISNVLTAGCLIAGGYLLDVRLAGLLFLSAFSAVMIGLSFVAIAKPSDQLNYRIFKFASMYMLTSLILLTLGTIL